jgi:trans-aconitate methyltransferase
MVRTRFDAAYYRRFYEDPGTAVGSREETRLLVDFVAAYVKYLRIPVRRMLDAGCGLGRWKKPLADHFPHASYTGVEVSDYLCRTCGWEQGSVVDYRAPEPFDLVVCQGVLQYLPEQDAADAIANLARLCGGALYLEVVTAEDWKNACDRRVTDARVHRRPAAWYRERLARYFIACGGGVFVPRDARVVLYELECAR